MDTEGNIRAALGDVSIHVPAHLHGTDAGRELHRLHDETPHRMARRYAAAEEAAREEAHHAARAAKLPAPKGE